MKVNPVGKPLSEVERAYLAGFIDGDGAIMALLEKHDEKRFGFRVRVEVKVTQYHLQDVSWLVESTGVGYIRRNLRTYEWIVRDQKAIRWLLDSLAPFIRCKAQQLQIACQILDTPIQTQSDLIEVAQLADALSAFNVRSQYRRKNYAAKIQESVLP